MVVCFVTEEGLPVQLIYKFVTTNGEFEQMTIAYYVMRWIPCFCCLLLLSSTVKATLESKRS